jgi:hypothetical protein
VILKMPRRGKRAAKHNTHPCRDKRSDRRKKSRRELGQNFLKDKRVAKRDPPLVPGERRHLFHAFVRRAFDGNGNSVSETLGPYFTKIQLRRLARDNRFSLHWSPSMLTVHQWARLFDAMMLLVPRNRWPSSRRHAKRES